MIVENGVMFKMVYEYDGFDVLFNLFMSKEW